MQPPQTLAHFEELCRSLEQRLRSQLQDARTSFKNTSNKGSSAERSFRAALAEWLPRRMLVGHGEVIDTFGHRSAQCDLVVATDAHPGWVTESEPALFLVEGVAAAAEVKTMLTSGELSKAITSVAKFRKLVPKWGEFTEAVTSDADAKRFYLNPPFFLFAYESQVTLDTICERLQAASSTDHGRASESIDGVFVLDRGFVLNFGSGGESFVSQGPSGERLKGYYCNNTDSPLLTLMMWLVVAMATPVTQLPILRSYLLADAPPIG